jgi:hypothetical protein
MCPDLCAYQELGPIPGINLGIQKSRSCSIWGIRFGGPIPGANSLTGIRVRNIPIFLFQRRDLGKSNSRWRLGFDHRNIGIFLRRITVRPFMDLW